MFSQLRTFSIRYRRVRNETKRSRARCLIPVTFQPNVNVAPPEVLEIVRWGCATDTLCSTALCECCTAHLSCAMFCECYGQTHCQNKQIWQVFDGDNIVKSNLFDDWVKSVMSTCISIKSVKGECSVTRTCTSVDFDWNGFNLMLFPYV